MNEVEVVTLNADGVCPNCGADYGAEPAERCTTCAKPAAEHLGARKACPMSKSVKPGSTFSL